MAIWISNACRKIRGSGLAVVITALLATLGFAQDHVRGERYDKIIPGGYMETRFTLSRSGQLTSWTHSWTNNKLQGFHGVVRVMVCNPEMECYISPEVQCGVAGKWDPGPSNRTCPLQVNVPTDIAATANYYEISQGRNVVPLWENPVVKRAFDQSGRLYREQKEDAKQVITPLLKVLF